MNWLYYLLEANLYLAAFYLLYKLLLQNSTFYNSNRYFLICSIVAAFAIPLIQLGFLKPTVVLEIETMPYEIPLATIEIATVAKAPVLTAQDYIFYGYLALALFLSLKFIISISKIVTTYLRSNKRKLNDYTLVELSSEHTAFSFFNILFIHPTMAKNDAVLRHEIIHIKHKHSWDILLLELLKICCWFNPIVYLIKKDVTLLHEYIADEKTTAKNITKHEYAMFLIENSMAAYSSSLVNQLFNQSILKSRINMLNKEKTANWARLKYLLAVPLGLGLLCISTLSFSKSYGYDVFPAQQKTAEPSNQEKKKYYPKYKHDKDGNYISLEDRLIVVNGKLITDNNKYYGTANADKIILLNSAEAIRKYGSEKGKNGAVELYGENIVHTFPPPVVKTAVQKDQIKFPPPAIEPAPKGKNLKKFPPPVIKPNQNSEKASTKEGEYKEIEIVAAPKQNEVVVQGYQAPERTQPTQINGIKLEANSNPTKETVVTGYKAAKKSNKQKLNDEIEEVQIQLVEKEGRQEIEIVPTQKVKGIKLEEKNTPQKEVAVTGYKTSEKIAPVKKVQGLKLTPKNTKDKTGSLKKVSSYQTQDQPKATTTRATPQKPNNVFSKAWTLYQPKVVENKDDRC